MMVCRLTIVVATSLTTIYLFAACAGPGEPEPPACGGDQSLITPTATRQIDPDLLNPPAPPPAGDGAEYCPTPVPAETPVAEYPTQFITTEVANQSLDAIGQELAAAFTFLRGIVVPSVHRA